ncbi:MAG: cellulase family glycosylhydrolase, partial [Nitrososphaerota archaeon]|nr:cellulase family glycosylhydrolase [Nitrososphaerota archaeon]
PQPTPQPTPQPKSPANNPPTTTPQPTKLVGVNYNTENMQRVDNETLRRDFARFSKDGLTVIELSLYWYRLEGPQMGDYNGTYSNGLTYGNCYLDDVKRFIEIANMYDLKVIIGFHTLWQATGEDWCTPQYVIGSSGSITQAAILTNTTLQNAFLKMVNNTVSYLRDEKIYAWSLLNEPWGNTYGVDNHINLIEKEANVIRNVTNALLTVKFISSGRYTDINGEEQIYNAFALWQWDPRIFNTLDFISLTTYMPTSPQLYNSWVNITKQNIEGITQRGKEVLIAEFGYNTNNDTLQASNYALMIDVFSSTSTIGWVSWNWNQYSNSGLNTGYNLLADNQGNHRLAYQILVSST